MSVGRLVAIFVIAGAAAFAGPSLTTIQDTLYKADGTPMNGTATITWNSFNAADSSNIGQQQLIVPIVNGSIYVQLVPNTTAIPASPYTVTYSSDGLIQFQEMWLVPPSIASLRVNQVRISSTASVSGTGSTTGGNGVGALTGNGSGAVTGPIPESGVTGLSSDLAIRPVKGSAFSTGRVALVDTAGAISSVTGNPTDCVYAGGTTGPCFDPTQLPGYSDGETPSGVVDGVNTQFVLAAPPLPGLSLVLTRNGLIQKQGFDYSLTGSTIQFLTGAGPVAGDTIIAWYRTGSAASSGSGSGSGGGAAGHLIIPTITPQTICSSAGATTSGAALTTLGTCTIPGGYLSPGDRLDIRYIFQHTGTAGGFSYELQWGATTVVQRTAGVNDAMVGGQADASVTSAGTLLNGQSYGTVLIALPVLVSASDSLASPLTIGLQAGTASASDSATLADFTVIRYPAISHP